MRVLIFLALLPCVACPANAAESAGPPAPSVSLDLPIVISERAVRESRVVLDADGDAHLLVVGAKSGALEHYRLHANEVSAHETLDADPQAGVLSAAFDGAGVLNVAYGGRLYAEGPSGWVRRMAAPECQQLTQAGGALVCAAIAKNAEPGHRGKWNFGILAIGGGMGAIPLPYAWYLRNHLLVIRRETSPDHWDATVLGGPGEFTDTGASYALAGSSDGVVHVLYEVENQTRVMAAGSRSEVLYARLSPAPPSSGAAPDTGIPTVVGLPLRPYAPPQPYARGDQPPCIEPLAGARMLLLVAGDSPYVANPAGDPVRVAAALGLRCYSVGLTSLTGFRADGVDAVHLVASIDHRDSIWSGAKYYDLCYQYRGGTESTEAMAIGRRSPDSPSPVSMAGDGHGRALVAWTDEHQAFLARWVHRDAAAATADPPTIDAQDPEVRGHCQAKWPSTLKDLRLPAGLVQDPAIAILPADEQLRDRIEGVQWDGGTASRLTRMLHLMQNPPGTVLITDKALYFMPDIPPAAGSQTAPIRMELDSLRGAELQGFGGYHWIAIHQAGGSDQYVASFDDAVTRNVGTRLASLIAQRDASGEGRH